MLTCLISNAYSLMPRTYLPMLIGGRKVRYRDLIIRLAVDHAGLLPHPQLLNPLPLLLGMIRLFKNILSNNQLIVILRISAVMEAGCLKVMNMSLKMELHLRMTIKVTLLELNNVNTIQKHLISKEFTKLRQMELLISN